MPRRRGDVSSDVSTPRNSNSSNHQSPRASTPSLDSAVGSAEGLGIPQIGLGELRPRSDGSDSLATSSALTSPEPQVHEIHEPRLDLVQPDITINSTPASDRVSEIRTSEPGQKGADY